MLDTESVSTETSTDSFFSASTDGDYSIAVVLPQTRRCARSPPAQQSSDLLAAKKNTTHTVGAIRGNFVERMKPIKFPELPAPEIFYEVLALFGVLVMTGVLAVAFRLSEGKW